MYINSPAPKHYRLYLDDFRYTWKNKNGVLVQVVTLGGAVISVEVPDKSGKVEDIVAGYDSVSGEELHTDRRKKEKLLYILYEILVSETMHLFSLVFIFL